MIRQVLASGLQGLTNDKLRPFTEREINPFQYLSKFGTQRNFILYEFHEKRFRS